jgi:RNA polymerase sigma factor (sigma-70 family)
MSALQLDTFLRHLRRVVGPGTDTGLTDAQLLGRFLSDRDEAAFEVLVWRHGPMVLGVCGRVLRAEADTEDAFQATFLTLLRKAGSISKRQSVGSWLHQVAFRVALAARAGTARRAARETAGVAELAAPAVPEQPSADLRRVLDEEVGRLPEKYRTPFVLCHLEGRSNREAAEQLGCPVGTVAARLSRARRRLRVRLTRRGVTLSAGVVVATALPRRLVQAALASAGPYAAAAPVGTARATALAEGAVRALAGTRWQGLACLVLLLALSGLGVGGLTGRSFQGNSAPAAAAGNQAPGQPGNPQAQRIRQAMERATDYLKRVQVNGHWEIEPVAAGYPGGWTSMALLALLESGTAVDDGAVRRGLDYLRKIEPRQTYTTALQTMVFCRADPRRDRALIERNVAALLSGRVRDGQGRLRGWTYHFKPGTALTDNSNTQFAVMALDAAAGAGVKIDRAVWEEIRRCYLDQEEQAEGGWRYTPASGSTTLSMTCAGVCGLLVAERHLRDKSADSEAALARGLTYLGDRFTVESKIHRYYILHSLGRVGQLSGKRVFTGKQGNHDWYRAGTELLLKEQAADGSWTERRGREGGAVITTGFGLLFLVKGK